MFPANWWQNLPCPLHPSWGLDDISELDLCQLKQNIDTDENQLMLVETAVYRAFLEFPCGRFFNQGRFNSTEAIRYLDLAKQHLSVKLRGKVDAEIGYGIIINTFQMWISADDSIESLLKDLAAKREDHPTHACYMYVTQAYFYSRLGPRWRESALSLYESALKQFPDNCEWLFGKALMLSREARHAGFIAGWENKHVLEKFQKTKRILKRILDLDSYFHLARAFLGQTLYSLGEEGAETEIERALQNDDKSRTIAMVAVRFYRRNKQFRRAEEILTSLLATYNTAEIHFQLGHLYCVQARRVSFPERPYLWRIALHHFDIGKDLNVCHYACYVRRAEMYALLGDTTKARALFKELFEHMYKGSSHLVNNEMLGIETALEMCLPKDKQVFSVTEIIKYSHRYITLAIDYKRTAISYDVENDNAKVKSRLDMLQKISSTEFHEKDVRRLARLKLADAYRRMEKFKDAETLYDTLIQEDETQDDKAEIIWGLGKCYHGQGCDYYDRAITMAMKLERMNQTEFSANELYADVYLSRARSELASNCAAMEVTPSTLLEHLEHAIEMGSLEACYLMIENINNLHQLYFSLNLRFPEILAKIRIVCEDRHASVVHTNFRIKLDDRSEIAHDEEAKRKYILSRVNELFGYDSCIDGSTCSAEEILNEYKQLEALRQTHLDFEYELLRRKEGENWNNRCKQKLIEVLRIAREILDHVIHVFQILVQGQSTGRSLFTIHFDWKKATLDKNAASDKLKKWIKLSFPGYNMPDRFFQTILKVQPMYDEDNLWLAALGSFNSAVKHKSYVGEETFDLELKEAEWIRLRSEDIVRRSCQEVERLVLYFLREFTNFKDEPSSDPTQHGCEKTEEGNN